MLAATLLGLLSALCYGATDFAAAQASRGGGVLRTLTYGQGAATVVLTMLVIASGVPHAPAAAWWILLATNILNLAGTTALFRAMTLGRITVVTPIAAAYGGIGALLSAVAGDAMPPARWVGLGLLAIGGILAARPPAPAESATSHDGTAAAVIHAIAAALLYGVGFWVQGKLVVPHLGMIVPAWSYYATGALAAPLIAILRGHSLAPPPRAVLSAMVATGLLGTGGYLTLSAGQATGEVAIVTALSSLASGVTALLARVLIGERTGLSGTAGIGLVLAGLALIQL